MDESEESMFQTVLYIFAVGVTTFIVIFLMWIFFMRYDNIGNNSVSNMKVEATQKDISENVQMIAIEKN